MSLNKKPIVRVEVQLHRDFFPGKRYDLCDELRLKRKEGKERNHSEILGEDIVRIFGILFENHCQTTTHDKYVLNQT